jgi:hypothetical protein
MLGSSQIEWENFFGGSEQTNAWGLIFGCPAALFIANTQMPRR